jgi:hypothetical protein
MSEKIVGTSIIEKDGKTVQCVWIEETVFNLNVLHGHQWVWMGKWRDCHKAAEAGVLMLDSIGVNGFQVSPSPETRTEYRPLPGAGEKAA